MKTAERLRPGESLRGGRSPQRAVNSEQIVPAGSRGIRQSGNSGSHRPQVDFGLNCAQNRPIALKCLERRRKFRCMAGREFQDRSRRPGRVLNQEWKETPLHDSEDQNTRQQKEAGNVGTAWRTIEAHDVAYASSRGGCDNLCSIPHKKLSRIQRKRA
jgi:hypothetical protein